MFRRTVLQASLIVGLLTSLLGAGDWPMWRHDPARSAVTAESIKAESLQLQWERSWGPNHVAWSEDPRLHFDQVYEPIVVGQRLFMASSQFNSVTSLDTRTGQNRWEFLTPAPVRFAPVAHGQTLLFGADDGHVYCLDQEMGELTWRINVAPRERLILGNDRLCSTWPIRGGVVVVEGKAYFTAGVWPFEGCLFGEISLDNTSPRVRTQILENTSPQGYLSMLDDRIVIPTGRGLAAIMDRVKWQRSDLAYSPSSGLTETHLATPSHLILHGDAVYDADARQQYDVRLLRPIVDRGKLYGASQVRDKKDGTQNDNALDAYDLAGKTAREEKDRRGMPITKYTLPRLWHAKLDQFDAEPSEPYRLLLKAGRHLVVARGLHLIMLDAEDAQQGYSVAWSQRLTSPARSAIVADGRLFVSLLDGTLQCWGPQDPPVKDSGAAETVAQRGSDESPNQQPVAAEAQRILALAGTTRGYAFIVGADAPELILALLNHSSLHVVVFESDRALANELRRQLHRDGFHGRRASVWEVAPRESILPPYAARLIVCTEPARFGTTPNLMTSLYPSIRPYGGAMFIRNKQQSPESDRAKPDVTPLSNAELTEIPGWWRIRRAGALPGAADWTHEYGDSANSLMSHDELVKAPLGLLWFGGPSSQGELYYNRHFWGPGLTVVNGRMTIQGPEKLTTIDIYTGELLWQASIRSGSGAGREGNFFEVEYPGFHFVSSAEYVYLVYPDVCQLHDAESGKVVQELHLSDPGDQWGKVRLWNDQMLITVFRASEKGLLPVAIESRDRHTGELQWRQEARETMPLLAVGGDRVYVLDGYLQDFYDAWKRRGLTPASPTRRALRCFDVRTGKPLWERTSDRIATWLAYSPEHDALVTSNKQGIDAIKASDGTPIWSHEDEAAGFGGHPEHLWDKVILAGDTLIDQRGPGKSYDLRTGQPIQQINPISGKSEDWKFTKIGHHCNYAIASPHLMTFRAATAGFFDRATQTTARLPGFRSGCRNSLIPAGGILNAPNYAHGCTCNFNIFTSLALIHRPDNDLWTYSAFTTPTEIERIGINFGAPGDRVDESGTLWIEYPPNSDSSPSLPIVVTGDLRPFRTATSDREGDQAWIVSSGIEGMQQIAITLPHSPGAPAAEYDVELYISPPSSTETRHFDLRLVADNESQPPRRVRFDAIDEETGHGEKKHIEVVRYEGISVKSDLRIDLTPIEGTTCINGLRLVRSPTAP